MCVLRKYCLFNIAAFNLVKKHCYLLKNIRKQKAASISMLFCIPLSPKDRINYCPLDVVCIVKQAIAIGKPNVVANFQGISSTNFG